MNFSLFINETDKSTLVESSVIDFILNWSAVATSAISPYFCMIGFNIESGDNHIEMEFIPEGFYLGSIMSCVGLISLVVLILIDKKVKYNCEDE